MTSLRIVFFNRRKGNGRGLFNPKGQPEACVLGNGPECLAIRIVCFGQMTQRTGAHDGEGAAVQFGGDFVALMHET